MTRTAWAPAVLAAALMAGCSQETPGTSRSLGSVDYTAAFAAAREVVNQYYPVEKADPVTGEIHTRPRLVDVPNERILGGSPARHVATVTLRKEDGNVIAYASVAEQRQAGQVLQQMPAREDDYDTVPSDTPAERGGATTIEQNETWRTAKYVHHVERRILQDLYVATHPAAKDRNP